MFPHLRRCKNIVEFTSHLKDEQKAGSQFLIWRSIENVRTLAKATIERVAAPGTKMLMSVVLDKSIDLADGETLYFYQEVSETLFKASLLEARGKRLELQVSGWPFLAEKRSSPRFEFVDVQYFLEISSYRENEDKFVNHQVVMRNISSGGFAFTTTAGRAQRFQVGDKMLLRKVEKISLPEAATGKVAHVSPIQKAFGDGEVAEFAKTVLVGVCFDEPNSLIEKVLDAL